MPQKSRRDSPLELVLTFIWDEGGDRREVHQRVVVGVEAAVQLYEALGRALNHAVVTGYQDIDAAPEAGPIELRNQQADVVVNLIARRETQSSITAPSSNFGLKGVLYRFDEPHVC